MKTTILIELSEGCNLDCSYCLQDKRSKQTLTLEKFKKSFDESLIKIDLKTCSEIEFNFYGGEPLLYFELIKDIMDYLNIVKDYNVFRNVKFTYTMPTNLLALTKEKVDFIVKHKINISFSHDGLNQENRPLLNGQSSIPLYDKKTESIKDFAMILRAHRIGFKIHSMIFPGFKILDNFDYISEKFGIEPEFNIVKDHGVWDSYEDREILIGELVTLLDNTHYHNRVHPFFIDGIHKIMQYSVDNYTSNCGAGVNNFSILDNGEVRACERMKNMDDMPDILDELMHPKCQTCEIKNYCDKGCPFETRKAGLVPLCDYYKTYFKICFQLIEHSKNSDEMMVDLKQKLKNHIKN